MTDHSALDYYCMLERTPLAGTGTTRHQARIAMKLIVGTDGRLKAGAAVFRRDGTKFTSVDGRPRVKVLYLDELERGHLNNKQWAKLARELEHG